MIAGTPCTQAITEAAQNGMKEQAKYLFQPSVCKGQRFVGKDKVGGDGSASNGWWIVGGGNKDFNVADQVDDPFVAWARDLLRRSGIDYKSSGSLGSGFGFAWPHGPGAADRRPARRRPHPHEPDRWPCGRWT